MVIEFSDAFSPSVLWSIVRCVDNDCVTREFFPVECGEQLSEVPVRLDHEFAVGSSVALSAELLERNHWFMR